MFTSFEKKEEKKRGRKKCFPIGLHLFAWQVHMRKRERENIYTRHSKRRNIYKRKRRRVRTYSSSYCLDIGALIFTTMYQLPSYYLHDMITSIVSSEKKFF